MTKEKNPKVMACSIAKHPPLEIGMIIKNFFDAVNEGDGERIFRSWKFMVIYLQADGGRSKKVCSRSILSCGTVLFISIRERYISPYLNRFTKILDSLGGNILLDLALEHLN